MPTIGPTVGFRPAAGGSRPSPAPAAAAADEAAPEQVIEMEAEQTSSLPIGSGPGAGSPPRRPHEPSTDEPPEYTMSDMPTGVHPGALPKAHGMALESTELSGDGSSPVPSQVAETGGTPIEPGVGGVVALHPGQLVGNFRISAKIGQGGMGAVYAAVHRQIGRRAAVKVLHGPLAKTADYAGRFLNEARAVNTIRHPGLVEIFDFGQLPDGTLYIIMEFLEGESLRAHERRCGPLAEAKAKALALQIAQALLAAHKNGIVHRDLKPENVMLIVDPVGEGAERVKVLDFGIAKVAPPSSTPKPEPDADGNEFATAVGTTMGTPKYMAPEQYGSAAKVDGKADVFALGVMLYEMVSGQVPFPKTSLSAFAEPPRPLGEVQPSISPGLAALVSRMLSAKADRRPTMAEVIAELTPPPTATGAQTTLTAPPPPPPSRSVWPWVLVLTLGVLGFAGAGLWALREHLVPPPAPSEITLEQNDLQLDVMGPRARALGVLYVGLRSADPELRAQAVQALGQSRDSAQWTSIASLLKDPELRVQAAAAEALGVLGAPEAQEPLLQLLAQNPPPGLRVAVAGALSRLQSPRGPIVLRELLASGDERVKLRAGLLLVETGDLSARPGLWAALQRQALPDDVLLGVLSKLAHSGDALATQQLNARMGDEGFTLRRISAAANLARIGDERALAVLGQAARTPGPQQLLASLMLAKVGDASGFPRLLRVATDDKEPLAARQVAIEGVAACGRRQGALLLTRILDERQASQVLRQSAAGAILQIAGGDPDQIAKQSLGWAQAALGHDSWLVRESATAVLGDIDSDQAVPLLSRALADPQQAVRRSAAVALGRKRLRGAVLALRTSLSDAEPEVRLAGMRAIGRIVDAIGRTGAADTELNARLLELTETGSPNDQLVACGTLLQLGDESQHERLRQALNEPDATTRQLVVETVPVGDPLLLDALGDQAQLVRFAAARRLAPQKVRAAAPVLREALGQGGPESVIAYGLLKKMGEAVSPPAGFGELLSRGDLPTSLALLDVAADLPPAEALPLLQKARFDSSPTLRRRVVEVAFALHKSAPSDASLSLIYSLLADPDVSVRARAGALAAALAHKGHEPAPVAAPLDLGAPDQAAPLDQDVAVADGDSEVGSARGLLKLEGEEKVRFQIDRRPQQVLSPATAEISLSPGSHRVKFAGGVREVEITPGATVVVQISATYADQLLGEAGEAAGRHEYARAQHLLDLVKSLAQRGRVSRAAHVELAYQQARVYEGLGRFLEAMTEYQRLLAMPEGQRKPEQTAAANAAVARLSQHLGRIEITKEDHGHCLRTVLWVHAGEHQIGQESGLAGGARTPGGSVAPRVVRVREGGKAVVELCKGAPP